LSDGLGEAKPSDKDVAPTDLGSEKPCNANALHGHKYPQHLVGGKNYISILIANGF
jgi:hypothetical protein